MTPIEAIREATDNELGFDPRSRSKYAIQAREVLGLIQQKGYAAVDIKGGPYEVGVILSGLRTQLLKDLDTIYSKRIQDPDDLERYTLLISDKPFHKDNKDNKNVT